MVRDADPFESALFQDGSALAAVVDEAGIILRANARLDDAAHGAPPVGRSLAAVFPGGAGVEISSLVRRAIEAWAPTRLAGMLRGGWHLTTARPMHDGASGRARCLLVCQPALPEDALAICEAVGAPPAAVARHHDLGPLAGLTHRELEILVLIGAGLTTAEVAAKMHRSTKTVEWHRRSLGAKLGVRNRVELALIVLRSGLCGMSSDEIERVQTRSVSPRSLRRMTDSGDGGSFTGDAVDPASRHATPSRVILRRGDEQAVGHDAIAAPGRDPGPSDPRDGG